MTIHPASPGDIKGSVPLDLHRDSCRVEQPCCESFVAAADHNDRLYSRNGVVFKRGSHERTRNGFDASRLGNIP